MAEAFGPAGKAFISPRTPPPTQGVEAPAASEIVGAAG